MVLRVVREGKSESIDLFPVAFGAVVSLFRGMEINRIWPVLLAVVFHRVEIPFGFGLARFHHVCLGLFSLPGIEEALRWKRW